MKKYLLLLLLPLFIVGCDKDDDNPTDEPKDLADINSYVGEWVMTKYTQGYIFENGEGVSYSQNVILSGQEPNIDELYPTSIIIDENETLTSYQENLNETIIDGPLSLLKIKVKEKTISDLQLINKIESNKLNIPIIGNESFSIPTSIDDEIEKKFDLFTSISSKSLVRILHRSLYEFENEIISGPNGEKVISIYEIGYYTR